MPINYRKERRLHMNTHHSIVRIAALATLLALATSSYGQFLSGQSLTIRTVDQGNELPAFTVTFPVDSTPGARALEFYGERGLNIDVWNVDATRARIYIWSTSTITF